MRVLFLSRAFPTHPETQSSGLFNRFRTLLKGAAASGADVRILFFVDEVSIVQPAAHSEWEDRLSVFFGTAITFALCQLEADDPTSRNTVFGILKGAVNFLSQSVYRRASGPRQLAALQHEIDKGVDLLFVHRLGCMPPVIKLARIHKLPRVFLDLDDIEHVAFIRSSMQKPVWLLKRLQLVQVAALMLGERRAVRLCERAFVCSELDVLKLKRLGYGKGVTVLPNTVAIPPKTLPSQDQALLFLGTFEYEPNVRAVEYFLDNIWPLIRQEVTGAKFVVGGNKSELIRHFNNPPQGVEFAGFIPKLSEAYAKARAVVCPILSGGGTRVKLVEAAAHSRPMISTTVGAEGLSFNDGTEILLGDSIDDFAAHCIAVIQDYKLSCNLALHAYKKVDVMYNQKQVVSSLVNYIAKTIN